MALKLHVLRHNFRMRTMKMKKSNQKGLTLVELIIGITIVTILIGITVPGVLSWMPDYRLRRAARELHGNLQYARMAAIKTKQVCTVTFNTNPSPGNYVIAIPGQTLKTVNLAGYRSGVTYSAAAAPIAFQPNGLSQAGGVVSLTNAGNTGVWTATVNIAGAVALTH
jgi:prepilin-type N-terminal cleavage/methylation domain-containing protein